MPPCSCSPLVEVFRDDDCAWGARLSTAILLWLLLRGGLLWRLALPGMSLCGVLLSTMIFLPMSLRSVISPSLAESFFGSCDVSSVEEEAACCIGTREGGTGMLSMPATRWRFNAGRRSLMSAKERLTPPPVCQSKLNGSFPSFDEHEEARAPTLSKLEDDACGLAVAGRRLRLPVLPLQLLRLLLQLQLLLLLLLLPLPLLSARWWLCARVLARLALLLTSDGAVARP